MVGATPDHTREKKADILRYLLDNYNVENPVMIGDTVFDVEGAKKTNLPCIGVGWGYGNLDDMQDAITIVHTLDELYHYLTQ